MWEIYGNLKLQGPTRGAVVERSSQSQANGGFDGTFLVFSIIFKVRVTAFVPKRI